jgi:hypothetical protein
MVVLVVKRAPFVPRSVAAIGYHQKAVDGESKWCHLGGAHVVLPRELLIRALPRGLELIGLPCGLCSALLSKERDFADRTLDRLIVSKMMGTDRPRGAAFTSGAFSAFRRLC